MQRALLLPAGLLLLACPGQREREAVAAAPEESPAPSCFVVDADAAVARLPHGEDGARGDPADAAAFPGAVFLLDLDTRELRVFAADPRFRDPQQIERAPDGSLLLVDFDADPLGRGADTGAVFRLDGESGAVLELWSPELFVGPVALAVDDTGEAAYVCDRHHRTPEDLDPGAGDGARRGALLRLDLRSGACAVIAADPRFRAPADLAWRDDGALWLLDADAETAAPGTEGALFVVRPRGAGPAEVELAHTLEHAVSPLGLLVEPEGTLLVFDANADPLRRGGPLGAVLRVVPETGATEVLASPLRFRDPVRGCLAPDGSVLFVDANADPERRGEDAVGRGQNVTGPGALFRLDRKTGNVTVVASPSAFVNPVDVARRR